ncbi:MAG: response regulator [Deltaproteobacteria bacterium]|nr:response regulator [Deltaproteobacteria bacterium]
MKKKGVILDEIILLGIQLAAFSLILESVLDTFVFDNKQILLPGLRDMRLTLACFIIVFALSLINDILDFSKIEAGQLELEAVDFDPEAVAYDVCELIRPKLADKPVEVLCYIDDKVPAYVKGDPSRLRQVLLNLMDNAVKFTESGEIELSMNIEEEHDERVKLCVSVRDTGIGIPQDKFDTIFEVFQQADTSTTRKYGGTGLGLPICKIIAKIMGGDVWAESPSTSLRAGEPGKGSTFYFTAWFEKTEVKQRKDVSPVSLSGKKVLKNKDCEKETRESIVTQHSIKEEAKHSARILLAEDNPVNQKLAKMVLTKAGYQVEVANNGQEAFDKYTKSPEVFDLIFMDVQMPQLDGMKATRAIRKLEAQGSKLKAKDATHSNKPSAQWERVPIVAMTAHAMKGDREKCLEAGMDDYISKPVKRELMFEMLEKWVLNKRAL